MRKLLSLIVLCGLIVGGWYIASPWLAMKGIVDAAGEGDIAELEERIDFAQLRDGTHSQLQDQISDSTQGGGLLERVGGAIVGQIAGGVVDAALTPRGLANIVTVGSLTLPLVPERFQGQELEWDVEREGIDAFLGVSTWEDGTAGPVMVFERDGLGWDLTGVRMAR